MGSGASQGSSDEPKTIAVFGATGLLGGAVARALLEDPTNYRVRAITRKPSNDKARKLAEKGAVIVTANMNDMESLEKALDGAYAVFLTTHYWEEKNKEKEIVRGLNAIDAAVKQNVKHIILNGSESIRKLIGKECNNLDSKAAVEEYLKEVGVTYTIIRLPFWYENFYGIFRPHKIKHGVYAIPLPIEDAAIDMISVKDIGPCVMSILDSPKQYRNKTIGLSADRMTTVDMAHVFSKHIDKQFISPKIRTKDYEKFNFPEARDLAAMFELYQKNLAHRDIKMTKKMNPRVRTFDKWLELKRYKLEEILAGDKDNDN
ncbi:hypothetical protein ACJMK2_004144 [Sinanodonta woodiana]|uniref:NmrA-like family domain-containing protein 1 n=1 Tax=Sinanodonta woodiana TaxID=1069815 RepID=A0ABD3Y0A3_SINWO